MWPTATLQGELTARSKAQRRPVETRWGDAAAGLGLGQNVGRRKHGEAMPRQGLGLGRSVGRRERGESMPRRGLDRNVDKRKGGEARGGMALRKMGAKGKAVR